MHVAGEVVQNWICAVYNECQNIYILLCKQLTLLESEFYIVENLAIPIQHFL